MTFHRPRYPWPKQPKYEVNQRVVWLNLDRTRNEGIICGIAWCDDSIAAWAVDYLPRWLWWIGTRKENTVSYEVRGVDGTLYSLNEGQILPAEIQPKQLTADETEALRRDWEARTGTQPSLQAEPQTIALGKSSNPNKGKAV